MIEMESLDKIFGSLLEVVRSSNNLPKVGKNYQLLVSYPAFADLLKTEGDRIFYLLKAVLERSNSKVSLSERDTLDEVVEFLEKANDVLAERVANLIDESEGRRKEEDLVLVTKDATFRSDFINTSWNKRLKLDPASNAAESREGEDKAVRRIESSEEITLFASKNVVRPQLQFQDLIDNSNKPFESKLKVKHNAKRPFESRLVVTVDSQLVNENEISDAAEYKHPYKHELDHFHPNERDLDYAQIEQDLGEAEENPLEIIDDEEKLKKLCDLLMRSDEFAVDLEHHSYRSFQGLTCLMQISTRSRDFIVDTLKLWKSMHILNEPFSDSRILKVFHGADWDIEWLQRDFGIYVVNMFDTSQAMRLSGMARFSLAHLVKTYFNKELNKQFQLADWRIRPLPEALINYARDDTRFLLRCYDRLKNELLDKGNDRKNLLISVFERSRDICLKHYEKPLSGERDYLRLCASSKKALNSRQLTALRELYAWRDRTARVEDESPAYVLPDHMLRQIAEVLPREMQGVLSCCNPAPPLVRRELRELHEIVLRARDAPADPAPKLSPLVDALDRDSGRRRAASVAKPHDFSHAAEDEEIVPLRQRLADTRPAPIRLKPAPTLCF